VNISAKGGRNGRILSIVMERGKVPGKDEEVSPQKQGGHALRIGLVCRGREDATKGLDGEDDRLKLRGIREATRMSRGFCKGR